MSDEKTAAEPSAASAGSAPLDTHGKIDGADEMLQTPHRLLTSTPTTNRSEAMGESTKRPPGSTGRYRGQFYARRRLSDVFPQQGRRCAWWFLDDGNHFRTLAELKRFLDERSK